MVEVLGRYSNLPEQGERIRDLLEIVPEGSDEVNLRTKKQIQRRLPMGEVEELKRAYRSGATLRDLAHNFEIHRTTAAELLERAGIARRGKGLTQEQVRQAIKQYRAGDSTATIGTALGFSADTIRQRLMAAGVPIRGPHDWRAL